MLCVYRSGHFVGPFLGDAEFSVRNNMNKRDLRL